MKKLLCGLLAVLLFPVVLSTIPCTVPAEETTSLPPPLPS